MKRFARPLVVLGLVAVLTAPSANAQPARGQDPGWHLTPLVDTVVSPPRWFFGTDGRFHLVYELLLANAMTLPANVSAVSVIDADSGATLAHLTGPPLLASMSLAMTPTMPSVALPVAAVGAVWLDVTLARRADIPKHVTHKVSIEPASGVPSSLLTFTGTRVAVDRRPPVALGPPLAGAQWDALGSCCDGPHRRSLIPINGGRYLGQRFAIDFNQLTEDNRPGVGDPLAPASFPTFGQVVIAVADATVLVAVDRYPDLRVNDAREEITPQSEGGNRVVLDLGNGRFAGYAHLQSGSVRVRPGDRVRRGQSIAKAGSSGTTGGPHLHFQVMDRPSLLFADGLPFVFDRFAVTGQTPPLATMLRLYDTLEHVPIDTTNAGPRRDAYPMSNDVVAFPRALP